MKFAASPKENVGTAIVLDKTTCKCPDVKECAWEVSVADIATLESITSNGITTEFPTPPADDDEFLAFVLEALNAGGAFDYNSDNLTLDGGVLKLNEEAQDYPVFVFGGVKTEVTELCNRVKYCPYQGVGATTDTITIDGVAADASAVTDNGDGTITVNAPSGSEVLINGNATEICGPCAYNWEA